MAGAKDPEKPWLKSYERGVPEFVEYREICLPEFLERTMERFGNRTAVIFQGTKITYRQLLEMVNRFAACLAGFGIGKGDAVAILLPNMIPCVAAYYAILKIGAIAVMNNPLYTDPELEHQFTDSDAKALITLDVLGNRMIDLRPRTKIRHIVYTGIGDDLPPVKRILGKWLRKYPFGKVKAAPDIYRWKDCLRNCDPRPPAVKPGFDEVAMYQYTGGTTGVAKGVMLTHANLSRQVQQIEAWFPKFNNGAEILLGALPYFHVFGLSLVMNLAIYKGWTQVLVPRPQPGSLLEAIRDFSPTFTPLVPTMYIGMLNHPDLKKTKMTSIKGAFSGAAPLPVEVIRSFEEATGAVIVEGYGMTETTPATHINPFAGGPRKAGSIGLPISDTLARIVDLKDGVTDVPVGERGELIVKGPQVMLGYKNRPEETAQALRDGWCYSGDIATMDEQGYFTIVDRKKDMIISGGYNVYPRDIEEVFFLHPKVQEACAIGIPHPTRGESVKVFVVLKEGMSATPEELIAHCREKLATYKLPTEIEFRRELPMSNVGKVLRKALRAEEMEKRKNFTADR